MSIHAEKSPNLTAGTAGLLLSLQHALPRSSPLARRARALAHRLQTDRSRTTALAAAEVLAQLLDATDDIEPLDDDNCLCPAFDD